MPFEEVFCTDQITKLPELGDWVPISVTACMHPAHFWVNFPYGAQMFSEQGITNLKNVTKNSRLSIPLKTLTSQSH